MSLVTLHAGLGRAAVIFMLVCGLWALYNYWRRQGVDGSFWGTLIIGEVLLAAIGVLGMTMVVTQGAPRNLIHILYGVLSILSLPAAYVYTGGRDTRRESLIYGLVCLFVFGLAFRALTTA